MITRTFTDHCNEVFLPLWIALSDIKEGEKLDTLRFKLYDAVKDLDVDEVFNMPHSELIRNSKNCIQHKLSKRDVMYNLNYLQDRIQSELSEHNKLFPDARIARPIGY